MNLQADSAASILNAALIFVGFFIFHILASRRQNRDECLKLLQEALSVQEKYAECIEEAWAASGLDAQSRGYIRRSKYYAIEFSTILEALQNKKKAFQECSTYFAQLRSAADEIQSPGEARYQHIADQQRPESSVENVLFRQQNTLLRQALRRAFVKKFH